MIYAEITPPIDVIEAMNSNIIQSPRLMATQYRRSMTRLGQRAVQQLAVEPPQGANVGITRLMTPRQRRAFWATNGFGGGIPHTRTHAIAQGWKYKVEAVDNGGSFEVYNDNPATTYVEGFEQQPFLAAIGWLYAPPILAQLSEEAENIAIQDWFTVSDPFAGIPA